MIQIIPLRTNREELIELIEEHSQSQVLHIKYTYTKNDPRHALISVVMVDNTKYSYGFVRNHFERL